MTRHERLLGLAPPIASALATATVLIGALWVQQARHGWPFSTPPPAASPRATPVTAGVPTSASAGRAPIAVTSATQEALGIRVEAVRREALTQTVEAVATVVPDESRISHVHTRVAGWLEELTVNTTGEVIRAGQPLARIFSQELLSSQAEYLAARKATEASGITSVVVASGRTRLSVLGMAPDEIAAIEQTGEPRRLVTVVAPRSGVVVNRGVSAGVSVDPSTTLLTIADLSRVWVFAEVPEASIPAVRVGMMARLDFPASGRAPFAARVEFLYPTLTERTRTLRVRMATANPGGTLRPGLYGTAAFATVGLPTMTVPRDAVVDTGREQHVFVVVGDRFEPRPVTLGVQLANRVEVRSGLTEGDRIVAAGVFLLDSESRLRATGGTGGHNHAATPKPDAAPTPPSAPPPETAPDPHAGHRE
jgi:membrane fusion protein, copper/silver efflux system